MPSEPEREPRFSPDVPNPVSAWIPAAICLVFALFTLFLTAVGLLGLVLSIVRSHIPHRFGGYLSLIIGGGLFSAFFLHGARVLLAMAKRDRRAWRLASGRCPRCGYDIRNLPDRRCPECGETWSAEEAGRRA